MKESMKVKINIGNTGVGGKILIDGKDFSSHCRGFEISTSIDDLTTLKIHLIDIEVEGEFEGVEVTEMVEKIRLKKDGNWVNDK